MVSTNLSPSPFHRQAKSGSTPAATSRSHHKTAHTPLPRWLEPVLSPRTPIFIAPLFCCYSARGVLRGEVDRRSNRRILCFNSCHIAAALTALSARLGKHVIACGFPLGLPFFQLGGEAPVLLNEPRHGNIKKVLGIKIVNVVFAKLWGPLLFLPHLSGGLRGGLSGGLVVALVCALHDFIDFSLSLS